MNNPYEQYLKNQNNFDWSDYASEILSPIQYGIEGIQQDVRNALFHNSLIEGVEGGWESITDKASMLLSVDRFMDHYATGLKQPYFADQEERIMRLVHGFKIEDTMAMAQWPADEELSRSKEYDDYRQAGLSSIKKYNTTLVQGDTTAFERFVTDLNYAIMQDYGSKYCSKDIGSQLRCGYHRHSGKTPQDSPFPTTIKYAGRKTSYIDELGDFEIYVYGDLTLQADGNWSFQGFKNIYERWDFNKKESTGESGRTVRNIRTILAGWYAEQRKQTECVKSLRGGDGPGPCYSGPFDVYLKDPVVYTASGRVSLPPRETVLKRKDIARSAREAKKNKPLATITVSYIKRT